MAFSAILRRSCARAAPLASRFIGSQRNAHSSAAVSTAVSALKRATLTPRFTRPALSSAAGRFFSTDAVADGERFSDKKLLDVIRTEIDVAVEADDLEKTVDAPADFPFKIEDSPGEQIVTLTREYEGETITVEVSMPNLITGEEDEGEDDDDDEDNDNESHNSNVPLLITVVKKDENAPYLEFDCTGYPDEIKINSLSLRNPATEDQLAYEGPDFFDLDENLQKAFHKYLEIRGIKPSTTNFLHEYMIEKDNKEYVNWLRDVEKFIEA